MDSWQPSEREALSFPVYSFGDGHRQVETLACGHTPEALLRQEQWGWPTRTCLPGLMVRYLLENLRQLVE